MRPGGLWFTVFACSFAVLTSMHALDQVRNGAALYDLNVKLVGSHASVDCGMDGATHQSVEDIATMRCLPHMKVLAPSCPNQTAALTELMAMTPGVFYLRVGREGDEARYPKNVFFALAEAVSSAGGDVALIAHCRMVGPFAGSGGGVGARGHFRARGGYVFHQAAGQGSRFVGCY
jgi:transketolase